MPRDLDEEFQQELSMAIRLPDEIAEVEDEPVKAFTGRLTKSVELKNFVGKTFALSGVGSESVKLESSYGSGDEATHFSFILDDIAYTAIEDPSDGYRSSMREIWLSEGASITNRFTPNQVEARWGDPGSRANEIVEFVDLTTGKVVIQVGTSNTDDYYPSFVGYFQPENMVLNETAEKRKDRQDAELAKIEQKRMDAQRTEVLIENGWGSW